MVSRIASIIGSFVMLPGMASTATAQDMRIQFAEKVTIGAAPGHTEFDAYGRRFSLDLESNERLVGHLPAVRKAQLASSRLLRGRIDGVPGSWVRLARVGEALEGAIWDGRDLYAITTRARIGAQLTTPLDAAPSQTVIYRLSDAIGGLDRRFCAVESGRAASTIGRTPLEQYEAMVGDIRAQAAAGTVTDQIEISLIGDATFQAQQGTNAMAEMLARLNIADGIFSEQVGILILATDVRLPAGPDPFASSDPVTLLGQVAAYREANPDVHARAIAHLVTGHDMDDTDGVAFLSGACDIHLGASLSDNRWATLTAAQVMAHELGHNLGAPHDAEAGSACAATPANFLMAPNVNGSGTFSACSLTQLSTFIAAKRGSCIVSANYADVAVEVPAATTTADDGVAFALPVVIHSPGNLPATQVSFTATLPAGITLQSATVAGGSCGASGANDVVCTIGTMAGGEDRAATLMLVGAQPGGGSVVVRSASNNDFLRGNDSASALITIRSGTDIGVTMSASATTAYVTDPVDLTIDITAYRSHLAHGATLDVELPGMDLDSISAGGNACAVTLGAAFRCQLVDLAPGAHTTVVAHARGRVAGDWMQTAWVAVTGDGDFTNNSAPVSIHVQNELGVSATPSSTDVSAIIGQPYDVTYTLTAFGRRPTPDVRLDIQGLNHGTILSVTPGGGSGACASGAGTFPDSVFHCNFATLSPGDVRTVTVRFRMDSNGGDVLRAESIYFSGTQDIVYGLQTGIVGAVDVDVAADGGVPAVPSEGQTGLVTLGVSSLGINAARNVVATLDVPAAVQLSAAPYPGWTCTLATPQRVRCSIATLATATGPVYIQVRYTSATAGQYTGHVSVTADGDAVSANNTKDVVMNVLTFLDVAMGQAPSRTLVISGTPKDVSFNARAGSRPVTGARIVAASNAPYWEVTSLSAGSATCHPETWGYSCDVGDLAANASIPVTVRYNALRSNSSSGSQVCVQIPRDSDPANDCASTVVETYAPTDIGVSVAQATVTATAGGTFHYPMITVTNGPEFAADVRVKITLPTFVTVSAMSASALGCTGTTTLECSFQSVLPNSSSGLDITLNAVTAGTFSSSVELSSLNDSTAGNNAASVSIQIDTAAGGSSSGGGSSSSGGSSSGGGGSSSGGGGSSGGGSSSGAGSSGGGGGGRMEWVALAFLGLLAARRLRGRDATSRPARHSPPVGQRAGRARPI